MNIKAIGIGSKGKEVIKNLIKKDLKGIDFTVVEGKPAKISLEATDIAFIITGMENALELRNALSSARKAKESGVLSVAIVINGKNRTEQLEKLVDVLIKASNEANLLGLSEKMVTVMEKTFIQRGLIDLDLSCAEDLIRNAGSLFVGIGEAEGKDRAISAAERALNNSLINGTSIESASKIAIKIIGGTNVSLEEAYEATELIKERALKCKRFFLGIGIDEGMKKTIQIIVLGKV